MADFPLGDRPIPDPPANEPRLESWGEIAAYLRREIRTVQRWEKYQGLPVRRLQIGKLGSVYAYRSELDKWYRERQPSAENGEEDFGKAADDEIAAHVTVSTNDEKGESKKEASGSELPPPRPRITRLHITITLLTLLVLAAAIPSVYFVRGGHPPVRSASGKIRLVVLPFTNLSGDPQQDYFSAGLTDEMITQLGRLDPERLGVIAATASKLIAGKSIAEIGRTFDVQYAMEGSVRRGGNQVRIDVQLIQVSDQTHLWADSYTGDLGDILRVQDEVAAAVASQIRVALPVGALGVNGAKGTARAVNPEAYDAYLRGRFYWTNRGDLHKSIEAYLQAIDKDPNYALAYAGLASAYALLGQVPYDDMSPIEAKPKAREAAEYALQLDPQLGEAHAVLANVSFSYDWNFDAAEREFQRALALGQNDPTAHLWFSHYCTVRNRLQQAHEENSRTLALDPVSPLFNTVRAEIYYHARQYDEAAAQGRRIIEQYPSYWLAYIWLGSAYREKRMYTEALQQFSEGRKFSGDHPVMIALYGHALALSGDAAGARKALADLQRLAQSRYVSSLYFAAIYIGLAEKTKALDWLDRAYKERNDRLVYLNVDPMADPLRSEPRFGDLMKRLHLP
ncbi:MAG TPA: tetratricopeptide repeat protein [Candidatus Acidoferrum sp.]|nr:tetratricopeptide repeat protein [Candidatus Acidoferrum sp.]